MVLDFTINSPVNYTNNIIMHTWETFDAIGSLYKLFNYQLSVSAKENFGSLYNKKG